MDDMHLDPALIERFSQFQTHIGYRMVGWEDGRARLHQSLAPELMNRSGIPHGGVYAALLDTAMGLAGCYTGDPENKVLALTLSLTVNFISRPKGELLIIDGTKTGGGRSSFFAEGVIVDETGEVVARGSGAFKYRKGA